MTISSRNVVCLGETIANASFDKENHPIKAGKRKSRFCLSSELKDPRFHIAGKIIKWWNLFDQLYRIFSKWLGYNLEVKTEKGEVILLNINSIASRLHVDKEAVKKVAKQGKAEEYLKTISSKEHLESVTKKVCKILAESMYGNSIELFTVDEDQLVYKDSGMSTGLTPQELRDGIEEAYIAEEKPKVIQKKSFKFWRNEAGEVAYLVKILAGGTYGKAYLIFDLKEGVAGVFKDARRKGAADVILDAKPAVENEFNTLRTVHKDGRAWGVQVSPKVCRTIKVLTKHGQVKERYGFIGYRYDGDYLSHFMDGEKLRVIPFESQLIDFHQLLGGLKRLADLNVLHGDIKPENILCKKTKTIQLVHIADMGGACIPEHDSSLKKLIAGGGYRAYTTDYHSDDDYLQSERLMKENNRLALIENEKKRDVFSMGTLIYKALTGRMPFPIDTKTNRPILTNDQGVSNYTPIDRPDVPAALENIVRRMLTQDSVNRLSAGEAFAEYDAFVKTNYAAIYAQIQEEIQGYVY